MPVKKSKEENVIEILVTSVRLSEKEIKLIRALAKKTTRRNPRRRGS
jgi:hypothetical protein